MFLHRGLFLRLIPALSLGLVLTGLPGALLSAQETPSKENLQAAHYTLTSATSEITVDGILNERAWSEATVFKLLYEWLPGDNVPPPVDTDCLVTFNRDNFYIAFRCYDPEPSKIRAHLMDRDAIDTFIQDDHISVMVDTFNDERRAFQFRVNPFGVQADANFSESEGYEDFSWDAIWSSAGKIEEWGYAIEIAIPFNQLRFPRTSEIQTWGIDCERSFPRNVRHRILSHRRDRNVQCLLCQLNKLTGFQGISPGLNLEIDPTLTANRTDERKDFPAGPLEAGKANVEPGITARWGITPNLILNATANPDFSHVEADVAQLEVNTRFALKYPEKRPFFLEGADFFLTPFDAVFTRTVADPTGGIKLTGKVGRNAFGFFGASDRINNLLFPSNQGTLSTSLDKDIVSGVFRYRRDMGQNSSLGALYTGRASDEYFNHVAGFDGFFYLSRAKSIRFQYLHSETDYPEDTALSFSQKTSTFGGNALYAEFDHISRDWIYMLNYRDLSPGFRTDYGYIPRVDIRRLAGFVERIIWGKSDDWFTQLAFGIDGTIAYDYNNKLTDQRLNLAINYSGPLQSFIQLGYISNKELYSDKLYNLDKVHFYAELKPAGGLWFKISGEYGDGVDYQNFRVANSTLLQPFIELGLGRNINLSLQHAFQRLDLQGKEIFEANLSQVRFVYNFNVRSFFRAIVQHLDVSRNPELYLFPVQAKTKTFFTQLLFSYKLNPRTVLFFGYSDNYLGMSGVDITRTNRTFFIKLGYAWTE